MPSYKLTVAYDGTDYHGWQWQPQQRSIDRVLRETFLATFRQDELYLVGASRTDAGVHAEGQVVRVMTKLNLTPEKLLYVWNKALPDDIVITDVIEIDESFHPQRQVVTKTYEYTFFTKRPEPLVQRFGLYIPHEVDMQKLARCLSVFVGTHDFRTFCKEEPEKDTIRTIESISLGPCQKMGGIKIKVVGKSFLRYMIRRIVGAALTAATRKDITQNDLKRSLLEKKLSKVLPTAGAKGLSLKKIEYKVEA
jgi:tRNA pseudouridine38-40 synthase